MDKQERSESRRDFSALTGNICGDKLRIPYRMIETFSVENFRGFRKLHLEGLKTINIIVGRSGAGKTALLEALRVAFGATPTTAWNLIAQRGLLTGVPPNPTRRQFETPWASLFFEFKTENTISLSAVDSDNFTRQCKVFFDLENPMAPVVNPQQTGGPVLPETIYPLVFERVSETGEKTVAMAIVVIVSQPQFFPGLYPVQQSTTFQMQMSPAPELGPVCELFQANTGFNMQQTAQRFSEQSIAGETDSIIQTVVSAFPQITSI